MSITVQRFFLFKCESLPKMPVPYTGWKPYNSLLSQHCLFHRSFETATISASFFSPLFLLSLSPFHQIGPVSLTTTAAAMMPLSWRQLSSFGQFQSKAHLPSSFCPRCTVLLLSNQQWVAAVADAVQCFLTVSSAINCCRRHRKRKRNEKNDGDYYLKSTSTLVQVNSLVRHTIERLSYT